MLTFHVCLTELIHMTCVLVYVVCGDQYFVSPAPVTSSDVFLNACAYHGQSKYEYSRSISFGDFLQVNFFLSLSFSCEWVDD